MVGGILGGNVGSGGSKGAGQFVLVSLGMDVGESLKTAGEVDVVLELVVLGAANGLFVVAFGRPVDTLLHLLRAQTTVDAGCTLGVVRRTCVGDKVLSSCPRQWSMTASCRREAARSAGLLACSCSSSAS
jgi:hypothetical protein